MTKPILVCTVGLPKSGKSCWCRKYSEKHNAPIVNPDSIRLAMHGQIYAPQAEPLVWAVATIMVRSLFLAGHHLVLLDATNTTRKRRDAWQSTDWETRFKELLTLKERCHQNALDAARPDLLPVIDRMDAAWESLYGDELVL